MTNDTKRLRWKLRWAMLMVLGGLFATVAAPAADPAPATATAPPTATSVPKRDLGQWKRLAESGDAEAQFQYARLLTTGQEGIRDSSAAAQFFKKSAEQGHGPAQVEYARCLRSGDGTAKDIVAAFEWLKKAAAQGDDKAQYSVGTQLTHGDATPKDEVAALEWLEKSNQQGNRGAAHSLDGLAARGRPTTYEAQATMYHQEAGMDPIAEVGYAACLEEGRGVAADPEAALRCYLDAARSGDVVAKFRAGLLLQKKPDRVSEAYQWLTAAGQGGISQASGLADALKPKLNADQLARAGAWIKEHAPPPAPPAAVAVAPGPGGNLVPGLRPPGQPAGSGSGFFVTKDGYLVTNFHVVKGGKRFQVRRGGDESFPAEVVATDAVHDLAVLKVKGEFSAIEIGNSAKTELGEGVRTVGFPRPNLQGTLPKLTKGSIVSLAGLHDTPDEFEIDVTIGPGNSGGALVDEKGCAVGIIRSSLQMDPFSPVGAPAPQNVNYAIKSSLLLKLLETVPDAQKGLLHGTSPSGETPANRAAAAAAVLIWVYEE